MKNLINYSDINKNKVHSEKARKEQKSLFKKLLKKSAKLDDLAMIKVVGLDNYD